MEARIKHKSGFTLIELMIVVVIIAILALLVIPRLAIYSRRSKESAMVANLNRLREAIEKFKSDTGEYPASLAGLYAVEGSNPAGSVSASGVMPGTYKGPYLGSQGGINGTPIPRNPLVTSSITTADTTAAPTATPSANWSYTPADGKVSPANSGVNADGEPYESL